ncbi:MAG TPA: sigma-70 family RNA polymerase sigma factor [Baekduia sp.]|nr:sigma-70 family RNA polymerase sigma factor [Baekduia sp.]
MSPSSLRHPARLAGASLLRLQSDERLAELAANGHEAAFDAIVDRYRTPLTRYCAGIVGPNRAEDAAQQALINAHNALQRTDEVRHLRSWLYRIAHNAALNVLRAVRDDVSLDAASDAAAIAEDGPAAAFERNERFRATVDALQELPERQRAALVLRELEGRSHEEIAETLGVTSGAARQHLMRARIALRGAVTAITPYPLIVRLAEMLASPGTAGWTDAAVGAGAGATLAKLTAGVAATGALVGGAVGTERVVHHHHSGHDAAQRSSGGSATTPRPVKARAVSLPAVGAASTASSTGGSGDDASSSGDARRNGKGKDHHRGDDHRRGHDGSSGSGSGSSGRGSDGPGRNGSDHGRHDNGSHGRRDGSGVAGGSDHRSGKNDDDKGSRHGSSGSGSEDSDGSKVGSGRSDRDGSHSQEGGSGGSDGGTSTSGRDGKGSDHRSSSGSSSGGDPSDDHSGSSGTTTAPTIEPTTTVATTTPSTSTTTTSSERGSGSGNSGSGSIDDSGSSDRSGSN